MPLGAVLRISISREEIPRAVPLRDMPSQDGGDPLVLRQSESRSFCRHGASAAIALVVFGLFASFAGLPSRAADSVADAIDPAAAEFFEKKIRPLLAENCYNCHSANTNSQGGLRIDDRNGLLVGGDRGPAIVAGDPENSLLIHAVRQDDELKMPPKKQLSVEQIADLTKWIKDGAVWPGQHVHIVTNEPNPEYDELRKSHWSWQPVQEPQIPTVDDAEWSYDPIDALVRARLETEHLQPVAVADKRTLIRRLYFDLTGLPPAPQDIDAFLWDAAPDAYERLVDRLLASPAFGERWGRHWLDIARYGESTGSSRNLPFPHAWRYRDYVIDAFNKDKPYDQFLREQIVAKGATQRQTSPRVGGQRQTRCLLCPPYRRCPKRTGQRHRARQPRPDPNLARRRVCAAQSGTHPLRERMVRASGFRDPRV